MKTKEIIEYGDFQTPSGLASDVIHSIENINGANSIIEPNCGLGSFVASQKVLGMPKTGEIL